MSNECKRWLERVTKRRRREIALEHAVEDSLQIQPEHTVPTQGWQVDLEQAMSELSDESRLVVSMFYAGDYSLKEISEFLGVSVNTVKSKLRRARQQLGSALSEHYGRFVKSRKLKGGFLMQLVEQVRHIPTPTLGFTWSSATVSKTVFSLITALCVLIGIIGKGESPKALSGNLIAWSTSDTSRWPIEVKLYSPDHYTSRPTVSGIPTLSGKHPLGASNRGSTEQRRNSIGLGSNSGKLGARNATRQLPAVAPANEEEILTFSGRVVDSEGAPVADAELLYSVKFNSSESATRTAQDGTFRFKFPRPIVKERDKVSIVAKHPKYAIGWQNFPLQNKLDIEIQLGTPGVISGRILNSAGDPILDAEARIQTVFSGYPTSGAPEGHLSMTANLIQPAMTDTHGEFVLRGLPQGATTNLRFQGPGYAKERKFRVPVGAKGLEVNLKPEARIEGRITYAETPCKPVKSCRWCRLRGASIRLTLGRDMSTVFARGKYRLNYVACRYIQPLSKSGARKDGLPCRRGVHYRWTEADRPSTNVDLCPD